MTTSIDGVIGQMMALGMPPIGAHELRLNAGRWVRYGPGKRAYYRIDERVSRAGRAYYVGAFGFKGNGPHLIEYQGAQLSPEDARRLEQERALAAVREERRRAREIQSAADRAVETWTRASRTGQSPYLIRKLVDGVAGVRYLGPNVIVPRAPYAQPDALAGVQIIRPDGSKRFTAGMATRGTCASIGLHCDRDPILIAEGLATAASCWLALSRVFRVVVAFDCGNLRAVTEAVRAQHARAPLLICADDDYRTAGNPGRTAAVEAAKAVSRCGVVYPLFRKRDAERMLTDFNDLHCAEGLDEVAEQISYSMQWLHKV